MKDTFYNTVKIKSDKDGEQTGSCTEKKIDMLLGNYVGPIPSQVTKAVSILIRAKRKSNQDFYSGFY